PALRPDMKNALLALTLLISASPLFAQAPAAAAARTYTITDDGKNYATFESEATLETITVDLSAIDTGIAMRNEHMRGAKFLDTEKFQTATFKTVSVAGPKSVAPNQPVELSLTGDFTLHGVTKRITVPVRVVVIPESELTKGSRGPGDWIHGTVTFA